MRFTRFFPYCAAFVGLSVVALALPAIASAPDLATQKKIAAMSVPFVPNSGQWNARAAFAAQTFAGTLFVTKQGELVYSFPGKPLGAGTESVGADPAALGSREATPSRRLLKPSERSPAWALTETLVDSKGHARPMRESTLKAPAGHRPMEGKVSYAIGNDAAKHTNNLNTYERVNLGDMYPGVNVQLRATGNNVEKIFTVAPRRDPKQINIAVSGADKLEIGTQGELIAHTGNGPVTFTAPIAFQENAAGERVAVSVSYALNGDGQRYGFVLADYDRAQALVIDPLLQSTYLGGTERDIAYALAVHPTTGDVYVAGETFSNDLPGVAGGVQSVKSSGYDAFVTRFNARLTARLQSTYFGGNSVDAATAIAIHPATGEVYVAGYTHSTDLPVVVGGAQSVRSSGYDAFVVRYNAALTTRMQFTYLGGTGGDQAYAIAIHPATGEIYVAGSTTSADLPGIAGGAQSATSASYDAFLARFNPGLTTLLQTTYYGGTSQDEAAALAIHPATGEIYVTGTTYSTDVPGTAGGAQSSTSTGPVAFVSRFNSGLTMLLQASYLGGTQADHATAIAIHPTTGEVYIAGHSFSTDLPGVPGGAQSVKSFGYDGFIARFNPPLTTLLQSTYLGGTSADQVFAMVIHPATGEVYVAGHTDSIDLPRVAGGAQSVKSGFYDAFVGRFNASLTTWLESTFLGGTAHEQALALAIHPDTGHVYVAGYTSSGDLPGVAGGAQSAISSDLDAFVARYSLSLAAAACGLDVDGDGRIDAMTDMLILTRAVLGFTGTAVTNGAIVGTPPRNTWALIRTYLNDNCGTNFAP